MNHDRQCEPAGLIELTHRLLCDRQHIQLDFIAARGPFTGVFHFKVHGGPLRVQKYKHVRFSLRTIYACVTWLIKNKSKTGCHDQILKGKSEEEVGI